MGQVGNRITTVYILLLLFIKYLSNIYQINTDVQGVKNMVGALSGGEWTNLCKLTFNVNEISVVTITITQCDIVGHVRFCDFVGTDVTFQLTTLSLIFSFF